MNAEGVADSAVSASRAVNPTKQTGNRSLLALVFIGVVLRAVQFFWNRSLSVDEAALALNLRERSFHELLARSLDFAQTAPMGFLLLQKVLLSTLGDHEYVLRLLPLAAGVLAVPLFVLLARRIHSGLPLLAIVAIFAASLPLIYFASDAKPYSLDVLCALLIMTAAIRYHEVPCWGRAVGFSALAAICVWISQPALFVSAGAAGAVLLGAARARDWQAVRSFAVPSVLWLFSSAGSVVLSLQTLTAEQREFMGRFWSAGFLPIVPKSLTDIVWLPATLVRLSGDLLGNMLLPGLLALLIAIGITRIARYRYALLTTLPILLALFASAAHAYPFGGARGFLPGRVALFLVPSFLILAGAGIQTILGRVRRGTALIVVGTAVLGVVLPVVSRFPIRRDETRDVLQHVARQLQPNDGIYLSYSSRHVYDWYQARIGLADRNAIAGMCARNDPWRQVRDLDRIPRSTRVWFVMTHLPAEELRLTRAYLDLNGRRLYEYAAPGSYTALYQMSDRAERVLPDAAQLYRVSAFAREFGCAGLNVWPADALQARR